MNRTQIEWTEYTWNPITGCLHGCPYCYARKITSRFPKGFPNGFNPTFHPERLSEPSKVRKPSKIFTVSMGDMFGEWVPQQWISEIFTAMNESPHHIFQILTKNPDRINRTVAGYMYSPNIWLGTSVEGPVSLSRIEALGKVPKFKKFISFEPLLNRVSPHLTEIDWVIIGARTNPPFIPEWIWVDEIIESAEIYRIPVFLKNTLLWAHGLPLSPCGENPWQRYPSEMIL